MPQIGKVVLSRPVGAVAGAVVLLILLGCMSLSFNIGCKPEPDGTTSQEGEVYLRKEQELDVYYPIPYASPPNLELSGDSDTCEIIEQNADHFHIRYNGSNYAKPHWKARGVKFPPPGAPPAVIAAPPASPPDPPTPTNGPSTPLPPPTPVQNP